MNKPVAGQTVYVFDSGRRKGAGELIPMSVTKVGRTYFTAARKDGYARGIQFRIEDGLENTDIGTVRQVYFSEQDYFDEQERFHLIRQLRECFDWGNEKEYTLSQLREVCRVLELEEDSRS